MMDKSSYVNEEKVSDTGSIHQLQIYYFMKNDNIIKITKTKTERSYPWTIYHREGEAGESSLEDEAEEDATSEGTSTFSASSRRSLFRILSIFT